ncbi:MAG: aromatic-ring-hydroxylating dioxygenase subunit beta [Alphaproteobacteria bacterium]
MLDNDVIEAFLTAYVHDIDDGALEGWPNYFTEDGIYQIITRENFEAGLPMGIMYCQGRGMMSDRIQAMGSANIFEDHTYCHILGPSQISETGAGDYQARTNFTVFRTMQDGRTETYVVGKYLDRITMRGDGPLLLERRVVLESRRVDILLVRPI